MPENVKSLLENIPPGAWGSAIMAAVLSALRVLGDNQSNKWQRLALETPTAGCIGLLAMMAAVEMGLGPWTAAFIAGMIGHVGTDYVRVLARRFANSRIPK